MKKSIRASIAEETVDIIKKGFYIANEKKIDIQQQIKQCQSGTILYKPTDFDRIKKSLSKQTKVLKTEVVNNTALSVANRLVSENRYQHIACLNFASAKNPGGGFLGGSQAQEESLCRASALYSSLVHQTEYYEYNRNRKTSLYSDYMIFSPNVPVFRNEQEQLLENPYLLSFITAPAVNAGAVRKNEPKKVSQINSIMLSRAENVLAIAASHHCDALILGAWGCGVFQNIPADVAQIWLTHLNENALFKNRFSYISFAVFDHSKKQNTYKAFLERFT